MEKLKNKTVAILRWSEKYTKTDMVYLVSSSFWMNLNTIITTLFSFLLYIAFANLIPKEIYGQYQFLISISSIIGSLTLTGINVAITQAVARNKEGSFKKSILVQLRWGIVPFIFSLFLSAYYLLQNNESIAISVILIGILLPILNTFNTYSAFLTGKKDFKRAFFYGQILNFSYYPAMIISLFFIKNAFGLIAVNLLVNTTANIILYYLTIKFYKPNTEEDPETITFGKHLSLAGIFSATISQFDNILVFHFLGATSLAIYAFASNIPDRFSGIFKSISNAAFPKFSERSRAELDKEIFQKNKRFAFFIFSFFLIYILLAPFFFHIFFPQYLSSVKYSQAYAIILALGAMLYLPTTLLNATKSYKEIYKYNFINSIVNILLMSFGTFFFGIWGLILSKGISNIFNLILFKYLIRKSAT